MLRAMRSCTSSSTLLRLDGEALGQLSLEERKARLRALVGGRKTGRIRYADHVVGHGREFFDQACRARLEGIVSKRRDLPYKPGRHGGWLKTKCKARQEFVIGGFTDPEGTRAGIGALLVGYYERRSARVCGEGGYRFHPPGRVGPPQAAQRDRARRRARSIPRRKGPSAVEPIGFHQHSLPKSSSLNGPPTARFATPRFRDSAPTRTRVKYVESALRTPPLRQTRMSGAKAQATPAVEHRPRVQLSPASASHMPTASSTHRLG